MRMNVGMGFPGVLFTGVTWQVAGSESNISCEAPEHPEPGVPSQAI